MPARTALGRNSHTAHSIAGGTPIEVAHQRLRPASLTTTVHVTAEQRQRVRAMNWVWMGKNLERFQTSRARGWLHGQQKSGTVPDFLEIPVRTAPPP
jgi:hypothetical protein